MITYSLVTGACGGLGKEFCKQLINGNNLFLTGRSEDRLKALKSELQSINGEKEIEYYACDLTNAEDRKKLFEYIDQKNIKFSGLYNVAGIDTQKAFLSYADEKLINQIRTNFEATLIITKGVLERRSKDLKILTVSSMSGTSPMPYFAVYSATKCALINFFTALRYEVKDAKITILVPGGIPTREDIINDIKIQGVTGSLSASPKEFVVKKALKGLNKNKRIVIPKFFNKFVYFLEKITPISWQCKFIAKKWSKKTKEYY